MRVFALSDLHVDYTVNARWIANLSTADYRDDILILAGDISDSLTTLDATLQKLTARFRKVLYVPGNHDLWVIRDAPEIDSLEKFRRVCEAAAEAGASMHPFHEGALTIVPLLSWYDYSFALPTDELQQIWMDYRACRWPAALDMTGVTTHFSALNPRSPIEARATTITFSHFLPRVDLMPHYIPAATKVLYPVLGTTRLEQQIRELRAKIHVYGHSHLNRRVQLEGIAYVNNAFGYPNEGRIASKELYCVFSC